MNTITSAQIKRIYALLRSLNAVEEKETLVPQFCAGRTIHLSELTKVEAQDMIDLLNEHVSLSMQLCHAISRPITITSSHTTEKVRSPNNDEKAVNMRRKILHYLGLMGYTNPDTKKFDYPRIETFIRNIGANNPDKVKFNYLTNSELIKITSQVEAIYKKSLLK